MRSVAKRLVMLGAVAALSTAVVVTATTPAAAQEEADAKTQAKAAYKAAKALFKAEDWAGALPLYQKADSLYPGAAPKYKIAQCLDKLGRAADAIAAYQTFADSNPSAKYAERVELSKKRIEELKASLPGTITISVTPASAVGVTITVNGNAVDGLTHTLPAGEHTVVVAADGHNPDTQVITITAGGELAHAVTLTAMAAPAPAPAPAPAEPVEVEVEASASRSNVPAYVTLGVAGAGAVLGTVFGVQALGAKSDFDADPTIDGADKAERAALIADMSFGVALTFGITGAVLLFSGDDAEEEEEASAKPVLMPLAGPKGGGLAATWTF